MSGESKGSGQEQIGHLTEIHLGIDLKELADSPELPDVAAAKLAEALDEHEIDPADHLFSGFDAVAGSVLDQSVFDAAGIPGISPAEDLMGDNDPLRDFAIDEVFGKVTRGNPAIAVYRKAEIENHFDEGATDPFEQLMMDGDLTVDGLEEFLGGEVAYDAAFGEMPDTDLAYAHSWQAKGELKDAIAAVIYLE